MLHNVFDASDFEIRVSINFSRAFIFCGEEEKRNDDYSKE